VESTIGQWGNSLGVRIARSIAEEAGLEKDTPVRITVSDGRIVIEAIRKESRRAESRRRPLAEYLSEITPENVHGETATGAAVGRERL
jgi:antitoxin MazE